MKSPLKVLISVLALGVMAASPLLGAEEEKAPAGETPKGGRGGREGGRGGRGGMMMNADARVAAIDKAVGGLTEDQKSKIKEVFAKSQEQMREQMQTARNGGGDRDAMRAKMEEMGKATQAQVRALLTSDEQKKKFDEMPVPARGGPGGPGGRGEGRKKNN